MRQVLIWIFFRTVLGEECCPENFWPKYKTDITVCSDNLTQINLNCTNKSFLLNPNLYEQDEFQISEAGHLELYDGQNVTKSEYCLIPKWPINETEFHPKPVALVCFPPSEKETGDGFSHQFFPILMVVSTLFLVATLIVYLVIPGVRDLSGKCIIAFVFCLTCFYVFLICVQWNPSESTEICIFLAFFTYFWSMSSFFWLNVITFNIWRSVTRKGFEMGDSKWLTIYFCWGFGIPILLTFTSLLMENIPGTHLKPNIGKYRCWFSEVEATWSFFYGPIAILLTVNVVMFIMTCLRLLKNYEPTTPKRSKALRIKFMLHFKLFLLMGITWIFEVLSFATPSTTSIQKLWIITDSLNSLQGVIIFLILVIFRKKVFSSILKSHFCNLRCPCTPNEIDDEESDTKYELTTTADALELKNSKGTP